MNLSDKILISNMDKFEAFGKRLEGKDYHSYNPSDKYGVAFICCLLKRSNLDLPELSALFNSINCITDYGSRACRFDIYEELFTEKIVKETLLNSSTFSKFKFLTGQEIFQLTIDGLLILLSQTIIKYSLLKLLEPTLVSFILVICFAYLFGHMIYVVFNKITDSNYIMHYRSVIYNKEGVMRWILMHCKPFKRRAKKLSKKVDSPDEVKGFYSALAELELIYMESLCNIKDEEL